MKTQMKLLSLTIVLLAGAPAMASSTVCAGEKLYYSDVRMDFGAPPRPGMKTGDYLATFDGIILDKFATTAGMGRYTVPKFQVDFANNATLSQEGASMAHHVTYFKATMTITKKPTTTSKAPATYTEEVVCRQITNFVP